MAANHVRCFNEAAAIRCGSPNMPLPFDNSHSSASMRPQRFAADHAVIRRDPTYRPGALQ